MDVVPGLAQSWEVLDGGRKYIFHLRDDVLWSDGTPVTARDVEYAWKRVLDETTRSPVASLLYDVKGARAFHQHEVSDPDRVGVQALDAVTLVVELEAPCSYFPQLLTCDFTYPVPQHLLERGGKAWTDEANIVTNGPFKLEAWQHGKSIVLERNPEYHGRFTGNVQRVELSLLQDPVVKLERYEADGLDVLNLAHLSPPVMDRVRQRHAEEYISVPELATSYVGFNMSRPPFNDSRVRRAFALAIDRETLADVVMRGYDFPATGGFVPPGMPGHSPEISLPYDPAQARQLLGEAGYPGGHGFPIVDSLTGQGAYGMAVSEYLQAQWRENLGVEITWDAMDWAMFNDQLEREPPHMFFDTGWTADYPDPDIFLNAGPTRRWTGWRNKAYDRLVEQARGATAQGERMKLYHEADRILVEETVIMPLTYRRFHLLLKPWVRKYPTSAIKRLVFEGRHRRAALNRCKLKRSQRERH